MTKQWEKKVWQDFYTRYHIPTEKLAGDIPFSCWLMETMEMMEMKTLRDLHRRLYHLGSRKGDRLHGNAHYAQGIDTALETVEALARKKRWTK